MSQVRFQGFCDFQFHLFGTITESIVVSLCAKLSLLCFFPNLSLHNMAASAQGKVFLETGRFYTESPKVVAAGIERAQRLEKEEKPPPTVENLNSQIGRRNVPPDLKDSRHFVKQGFCGHGAKPDQVRVSKQVTVEECERIFGPVVGTRKKFRYTECKDQRLRAKIEKLWPLLNLKTEMPSNALLPIEFLMEVVAEEKLITVNWATYGEDVNTVQRSQYFRAIADLTRDRDELLAKSHHGLGSDSLVKVPAFGSTHPESGVFLVEEFPCQLRTMSTLWARKLAMEVSEFLEVTSIEWWSTKHMVERTTVEKKELVEKARGEMAVMDLFSATAELEREHIDNLQELRAVEMGTSVVKTGACGNNIEDLELPKSSALGIIGDQGKEPNVYLPISPPVSEDLVSCHMKYKWLLDMVQSLETTYKVTAAELGNKAKALQEMEQQWDF
jgi:hypothetical protein